MPHEEGCKWADLSADKAVAKTFAILGVDINEPESVEEFREDLRFGKHFRKFVNQGRMTVFKVVLTAILVGLITSLWIGIKSKVGAP